MKRTDPRLCTTHHTACDCREAQHATERAAADALAEAVERIVRDGSGVAALHRTLAAYRAARGA